MLKKVIYLEGLKKTYQKLNMELANLAGKKGATESGGRKAQGYSNVMNERNHIRAEYDELKPDVLKWIASTYSDPKHSEKLKCYRKYFDSISESDFQSVINSLCPPNMIGHKDEGRKVPQYKAGNLLQALYTSCLHDIENS